MINVTKLLLGGDYSGDDLRYPSGSGRIAPVVVWNCTNRCGLRCRHCYGDSGPDGGGGELSRDEAEAFIGGLAAFGVPVLLFSGGEPLMRRDLFELASLASSRGIRPALSTNGTMIGAREARLIRESGFRYAGVSLDGVGERHDLFRGVPGAFERAAAGLRACAEAGVRTGIRFTLTAQTAPGLGSVLDFARAEGAARVCVYHLVPSGRGRGLAGGDLSRDGRRAALDLIAAKAREFHSRGEGVEILTVDNHSDGVYLYLRLREEDPSRADAALDLLRRSGGNRSGTAIACVGPGGEVYPDQFMREHPVGNVRERGFAEIWSDGADPLLAALRDRRGWLTGRCGRCAWLDLCNGNLRARAFAVSRELWGEDPSCCLTDGEVEGDGTR